MAIEVSVVGFDIAKICELPFTFHSLLKLWTIF